MTTADRPPTPVAGPALVVGAAVVALFAIIAGVTALRGGSGAGPAASQAPTPPPTPTPSRSPEQVIWSVPWLSGPVAEQPPPPPSWPGFPDSTPCAATAVRVTVAPRRSDEERTSYLVTLRNTGTEVCSLDGYPPAVRAVRADGSGAVLAETSPYDRLSYRGGDIVPGQYAHLVVETSRDCRDPKPGPAYPRIVVTMPGGGSVEVRGSFDMRCGFRAGRFGYPPEFWPPAPTRYAHVTAAISAPPTAVVGRPFRYHVTLTSSRTFQLDPCPSYVQSVRGRTLHREFHLLNCGVARQLRAGEPVRFEMVVPVPDEPGGSVELEWRIQNEPPVTAVVSLVAP